VTNRPAQTPIETGKIARDIGRRRRIVRSVLGATAVGIWFCLNGLLWYARPPDGLWLSASLVLGVIFFGSFLWYVSRDD